MSILHLDFETTSKVDIKKCGGYRYANDPSTRILMFGVALDDGPVKMWRFDQPDSPESQKAKFLLESSIQADDLIYAHNCSFELAISHYRLKADLGIDPPQLHQWRDTMAMCNRAAINPGLKEAAQVLRLPYQKSAIGMKLITIFSDQNKEISLYHPTDKKAKVHKTFHPLGEDEIKWEWLTTVDGNKITLREAWELFIDYCRQDVLVEREIHKKLHKFELEGDILESFQFDLGMNFRGVPINRKALTHAAKLVKQYKDRLEIRFKNLCGFTANQNAKGMAWLKERGYPKDSLAADVVDLVVTGGCVGMTPEGVEVLKMRSLLSFAALGKIDAMLRACCDDGYVRGTTQWYGARTGRATGRIIQPQNMKKATIEDSELAYGMICDECPLEDFETFWASPLEVIASCIRHFIQPHEGLLLDADYTGVEARIAPWLAGATGKLQSILRGEDQYKVMASKIVFNIPYEEVTKVQRNVGKPIELSCVYGTGGHGLMVALRDTHKIHRTLAECNMFVKKYREEFPEFPTCWREMEKSAEEAILNGKTSFISNGMLGFGRAVLAGMKYLVMRLPSGRKIYYPDPKASPITMVKLVKTKKGKKSSSWERLAGHLSQEEVYEYIQPGHAFLAPDTEIESFFYTHELSFYGKVDTSAQWGRIKTWGSRLFENACQAIGADFLNYGCIQAQKSGYTVFQIIHDQSLAYADKPLEGFIKAFCSKQPWAKTFPLEATGAVHPFYLKD